MKIRIKVKFSGGTNIAQAYLFNPQEPAKLKPVNGARASSTNDEATAARACAAKAILALTQGADPLFRGPAALLCERVAVVLKDTPRCGEHIFEAALELPPATQEVIPNA